MQMKKTLFRLSLNNISLLLLALLISGRFSIAHAQTISTVAGSSGGGPVGVALDGAGNIFISDKGDNRVRKVATNGIVSTVAGSGGGGYFGDGGPATNADMFLEGIAADAAGNFFIAETFNFHICKVNTAGIIHNFAGNGTSGFYGVGVPATTAKIWDARSVTVDAAGNVYFADGGNDLIRKVNTSGIISTVGGTDTVGYTGDGGPATNARLNYPQHIYVDNTGNIFFADTRNHCIRKINASGIISTFAGNGVDGYSGDGGPAVAASLDSAGGIVEDAYGSVYIADSRNNRIRKVDIYGTISTIAGNSGIAGYSGDGGPATAARLYFPVGLAMGCGGQLYIADYFNDVVRVISHGMAPAFTAGHTQTLTVCENATATPINAMLIVNDTDLGQTENWSTMLSPAHGSIYTTYSTTTTGSLLTPSGLLYLPYFGFVGTDSFKVRITDCGNLSDSTTIYVTVNPLPAPGAIIGADSMCLDGGVVLSDTAVGGVWTSSNTSITTISAAGLVTPVTSGVDTLFYTFTNSCGSATVAHPFKVRSYASCFPALNIPGNIPGETPGIYPNPSTGIFTVSLPATSGTSMIFVSDIYGKKIESRITGNPENTFDLSHLAKGTYIIKIQKQESIFREKITIW
jgi:hypothetical protein